MELDKSPHLFASKQAKDQYLVAPIENWQNWRLKSLNSGSLQRYSLPLGPKTLSTNSPHQEDSTAQKHTPKITKINNTVFSILLNNTLNLFQYVDETERQRKKLKFKFAKSIINNVSIPNDTEWVEGDGTSTLYVASKKQIVAIKIGNKTQDSRAIQNFRQVFRKKFNSIKGFAIVTSNIRKILIIITSQSVLTFDASKDHGLIRQCKIKFSNQSSGWNDIDKINGISIVVESLNTFYFVGTSIQLRADVRTKLGREKQGKTQPMQKKCEALYLTKLQMNKNEANARIFIIDHIFQIGIFKKSRVYQVGNQTFILCLYQEIIVIRRNFSKFMVWDNVSIASSKSNEKKGQLVLADKRIMVYTQQGQISAHQIYFNFRQAKLQTPKIDSFKGNNNEEQILYDAVILQYKQNQYMKVLFYFKQAEVFLPNVKMTGNTSDSAIISNQKNEVYFQAMCIEQTEPTDKLKQLLEKNKGQQQIESFLKRFNIKELRYKKSQWQVSEKGEKQIQSLLLNIKDNQYIQSQLTKILKQKSHDLQFLITIERKQIDRYRLMVASKLLLFEQHSEVLAKNKLDQSQNIGILSLSELFLMRELDEVKLSIQWLLQSKMLFKKLMYSTNFMTFKEYDFIQIGKLRTASLREEIKLLGVKGYEKRLKYFLNSFKYLVLDDFKQILRFVIAYLNEEQVKVFFLNNFPFILPSFKQIETEDRCRLWENSFKDDTAQMQTLNLFRLQVEEQLKKLFSSSESKYHRIPLDKAIQAFNHLFNQFIKEQWFIENSYKQHSLLRHSVQELQDYFQQLKDIGVYDIIVQFLYEGVDKGSFQEDKVASIITEFTNQGLFSAHYTANLQSRLEIFDFITLKVKAERKKYSSVTIQKRSSFIIEKQHIFFSFLIQNFSDCFMKSIKQIYKSKKKQLFSHNLSKFLNSQLPVLQNLIDFMKFLQDPDDYEIRKLVFNAICSRMQIIDSFNAANLVKNMVKIPVNIRGQLGKEKGIIDEAVVAFGSFLSPLFKTFEISVSYNTLIQQTKMSSLPQTSILYRVLKSYPVSPPTKITFPKIISNLDELPDLDFAEVIDFFSLVLYCHKMLDFKCESITLWKQLLLEFIQNGKYDEIGEIVEVVDSFGRKVDDRQLAEQWYNYEVLVQFKHQYSLKKEFENVVFQWVQMKYKHLVSVVSDPNFKQEVIKQSFYSISRVLQALNHQTTTPAIAAQISLISLFSTLLKISPKLLVLLLPSLALQRQKYSKISSFTFMVNVIGLLPSEQRTIFSIKGRQQILQLLLCFTKVQKQYAAIFGHQHALTDDLLLGQICKFNSDFVTHLVTWGYPRVAAFVILDLINSTYYYRDVLFYFVARIIDPSKVEAGTSERFIYQCLSIQNSQDLRKILKNFIVKHSLSQIVPNDQVLKNIIQIFNKILKNNKLDEAFFFAIRNIEIQINVFLSSALSLEKFRQDHVVAQALLVAFIRAVKEKFEGQNWPTFMLFKTKINCLMKPHQRMQVIKDIAIVMGQLEIQFLKQKVQILEISKKESKGQQIVRRQEEHHHKFKYFLSLKQQYQRYMRMQNLNPMLSINSEQIAQSTIRLQKYPDYSVDQRQSQQTYFKILPIIRQQESNEVKELRKRLFENEQKLRQIQDSNRQLMEQQLVPAISQAKINAEKEHLSLIERKKKKKQQEQQQAARKQTQKNKRQRQDSDHSDYQNSRLDGISKLEAEQKEKIAEMKKTYTSKIVQQTQNLIAELREKRRRAKQQTALTYTSQQQRKKTEQNFTSKSGFSMLNRYERSIINGADPIKEDGRDMKKSSIGPQNSKMSQGDMKNSGQITPRKSINTRQQLKQRIDFMRQSHLKGTTINRLMADKNGQFYVPRWQPKAPLRNQFEQLLQEKPKKSSQFLDKMKKEMAEEAEKAKKQKALKQKQKKLTLEQIVQKYKKLNENEAASLIQKITLVLGNPSTCVEIIKNVYTAIKQLKNFIELCRDLLLLKEQMGEFIQHKSLKIVQESLKIKVGIPFKQIFPSHLFTTVHNSSMRDYYHVAYVIIHPNIIKLMQQPNCNINSIAMMIRFGFGSDSTFYYKVFEDYIKSLIDVYDNSGIVVEKDLMLLSQRLRSNFNNLNPSSKKIKFEELIRQIKNQQKRKDLVKAMLLNLENKSSMVNKESYEEFRVVLVKLEDSLT